MTRAVKSPDNTGLASEQHVLDLLSGQGVLTQLPYKPPHRASTTHRTDGDAKPYHTVPGRWSDAPNNQACEQAYQRNPQRRTSKSNCFLDKLIGGMPTAGVAYPVHDASNRKRHRYKQKHYRQLPNASVKHGLVSIHGGLYR